MILYVPPTIFQLNRNGSFRVEPVLSYDKCVLLKDHNAVTPVRLEPAAPRSQVKHSTTELPVEEERERCFLYYFCFVAFMYVLVSGFHCAIGGSVICDCGISWAFSLVFITIAPSTSCIDIITGLPHHLLTNPAEVILQYMMSVPRNSSK